jgi:sugar/nucleoside kinase (ribokinase family)
MKKVLGIGNALVDLMTQIDNDNMLSDLNLPKGSMQLVDKNVSENVINKTKHLKRSIASGGSAANTIHGLARLGVETGFIGKIGKNEMGTYFREDMIKSGISPLLLESDSDSGVAVALVSPDGERTFATFLGAAIELSADDLTEEMFKGYDILHIEGYLLQNYALIEAACGFAQKQGLLISLDLASFNVVEDHRDFLAHIAQEFADIIFANEEEAKAMTGHEPEDALHHISEWCNIAIVKIGKEGSLIKTNGETTRVDAIQTIVTDTTGAGDLYASGFLFGVLNDYPMEECGRIGTLLAKNVIEQMGAKIPDEIWKEINTKL